MKNEILIKQIKNDYLSIKDSADKKFLEFKKISQEGADKDIFIELVFCLLTPQSKARTCWTALCGLLDKKLLFSGDESQISNEINTVRFRYNKARYIVEARKLFKKISIKSKIKNNNCRDWLVKNVKGLGYKEASHFLRNIGLGENLAILDRHILKNLKAIGTIPDIPKALTPKKYLEIEKKMIELSIEIEIPMCYLDFVLWHKETGDIFK